MTVAPEIRDEAQRELARRALQFKLALSHPKYLLEHIVCTDAKTGKRFKLIDDEHGWAWQGEVLDWWLGNLRSIILKARQLGVTWLACGLALWVMLTRPGTKVIAFSIGEDEAKELVGRVWDMYESLPDHLRFGVEVVKPQAGSRPSELISFRHPDGRISSIRGYPSTESAGHSATAGLVLLDEAARQPYARSTWKAVVPTAADVDGDDLASLTWTIVISTANGVSNAQTGGGNFFHHLWVNARLYNMARKFLSWRTHPRRTQEWYDNLSLPAEDKAEQYPDNADEAFLTSGRPFFDRASLRWYAKNAIRQPLERGRFVLKGESSTTAVWRTDDQTAYSGDPGNVISLFTTPEAGHDYAIICDVASGDGRDNSAAFVTDLSTMEFVAQVWGRFHEDVYAEQLHYLGRWYNDATIAIENQGGYGTAVVILLRDGKHGRPPYPLGKLYRHKEEQQTDEKERRNYGYPVTGATRPLMLSTLSEAIRERSLPYVTEELLEELSTFVHKDTNPSPRAEDGSNDDLVMAAAGATDIYRRKAKPTRRKRGRPRKKAEHSYPWQ